MKRLMFVVMAAVVVCLAGSAFAEVNCDLGVYSRYVNSTGEVNDRRPVTQGECTKSFANGLYVNGWFSQSLINPGIGKTLGNKVDLIPGWTGQITEKWSADVHIAYEFLANPRFTNTNGAMANAGGTLTYKISDTVNAYTNAEYYYGIGSNGFPNYWQAGVGVNATVFGLTTDTSVRHNQTPGESGEFVKFVIEPKEPLFKMAGGEVRPTATFWLPIGRYNETHDPQIMAGLRINW